MNTSLTSDVTSGGPPDSPEVNPGTPASPSEAVIASRLTSHLMQQPRPTFCPLCPGYFYSQTELQVDKNYLLKLKFQLRLRTLKSGIQIFYFSGQLRLSNMYKNS